MQTPTRSHRPAALPSLQIAGAALLFSTGGAAIKASSLSSWQIAGGRSLIAALVLLMLLPEARRGWSRRSALVSLAHAATMFLYVAANKLTTAANTIFLQDTAPFYVLILSPLLLKEPIRPRDILLMIVILLGLGMFFLGTELPQTTAPDPLTGNALAAVAGAAWALTILGLRWLARTEAGTSGAIPAVVKGNLLACLCCLPFGLPVADASVKDIAVVGYLGVFQVGLAYVLLTRGVAAVPALTTAILLLIEPVFTPVWTFMQHGEVPGIWAIAGGTLILGATVVHAAVSANRSARRRRSPASTDSTFRE